MEAMPVRKTMAGEAVPRFAALMPAYNFGETINRAVIAKIKEFRDLA